MHLQFRRALTASVLPMVCLTAFAQKTVTGTVKDAKGEPLIGVTVFVDGKPGSITDIDGNFSIPNASPSTKVKVSYIGYKEQTVTLGNSSTVNITLQEDNEQLDEVVVVGYGTMKKSDLTGSVSSVSTEALNAKGAPSLLANLQGSTPGVNITQSTGRTNGDFNIEIRGKSSISSDTKPMYVVDGVICSDIQFLNPQDIERIDVLKDASSTAIYGSRATAGVIMVTTKSGSNVDKSKLTKPTISYDGYYGVTKVARMPDFMDANEFMNFRFAKFLGYAGSKGATNNFYMSNNASGGIGQALLAREANNANTTYALKEMVANGQSYDWPDLVTQTGQSQNHYLSVAGASDKINYHFGVGYDGNKGTYKGDNQDKLNFKGSVDARVSKVISAGFSMNMAYIDNEYANDDAIKYAFRMTPFSVPYDKDGNVNHRPGNYQAIGTDQMQFSDNVNPLDLMKNTYKQRETWRLLGNIYLQLDILKGLNFKTTFSPSYTSYRQGYVNGYENPNDPGKTYASEDISTSSTELTNYRSLQWTWDNVINYNTRIAKDHSIGVMGLVSAMYGNSETYAMTATGVRAKTDWYALGTGALDANGTSSEYGENSMLSYALRVNYGYKDKYLLTATARWDGSSKFDPDYRWGCFPSVALAWRASEEEFIKKLDWISNLKFRLSYGVTGNNQGVGNYATIQAVSTSAVYYPFGSTYYTGFAPGSIVDKKITWETSKEINFGIDFGFLNNRISGAIDIYNKKSQDLLYNVQLPLVSGGGKMKTNIGSVRNTGVEISLQTVNIVNKDWNWTTSFTFAHNKNKVLEINGTGEDLPGDQLFIGQPFNNVYDYNWTGIVTDQMITVPNTDIAKAKGFTPGDQVKSYDYYYTCYGWTEGEPIIEDVNGDGSITPEEDKKIWSSDPAWTGSLTSNLSYKNWDFSFSIYTKQNFKVSSNFMSENVGYSRAKQMLNVDYYIPAGTLLMCDGINADGTYINPVYQEQTHYGSWPMAAVSNGFSDTEQYFNSAKKVVDGSFVKVKNITLGYTFPQKWINKFGCKYLRLYATVTNPFVFTKYKGFDPEWADAANKNDGPSTITYQIGASIKF